MGEPPVIGVRDADPAKRRYGPIVYGLKLLIEGVSQSTGMSFSSVVTASLAALFLGAAVMLTAAVVLIRDARPKEVPRVDTGAFAAAPPPDRAQSQQTPSPAPTGYVGTFGSAGASPAHFDTPPLADRIEPEAWPPRGAQDEGPAKVPPGKKPWPERKKWNVAEARYPQFKSGVGKSDMDSKVQAAVKPDAGGKEGESGRFTGRLRSASGRYAEEIPGAPALPEGTVLGEQGGTARAGKKDGGPVAGPVKQEKIPDVGPGKQIDAARSPEHPVSPARVERAADPLSTPVDVNRIVLDPSKANNIDAAPGINQIGK